MIQELKLKNFNKHRALHLCFSPHLNVLVGHTDAGKSACLRALSWVARHETLSQGTITHGETSLRVGIKTDKGTVVRFKDSSGYGYKAGGETFLACAQKQPKEVADILNLADINFQGQHDAPFMLSLTPGKLAEAINDIVDLAAIDMCQTWLKSQREKSRTLVESGAMRVAAHQATLESLAWVNAADEAACALEAQAIRHKRLVQDQAALAELIQKSQELEALILTNLDLEAKLTSYCSQAAMVQGTIHRTKTRKQALGSVVADLQAFTLLPSLEAAKAILVRLVPSQQAIAAGKQKAKDIGALVSGLQGAKKEFLKLSALAKALKCIIANEQQLKSTKARAAGVGALVAEHREIEHEIPKLIQEQKNIEEQMGVCPACGRAL